ncbi:uncharacterized protein [Centroberyx affinis]|uniref:uncharacterized protein n=1 Tax=Centroberyx affinis TaxID=166261 RepID=UPI003A5C3190
MECGAGAVVATKAFGAAFPVAGVVILGGFLAYKLLKRDTPRLEYGGYRIYEDHSGEQPSKRRKPLQQQQQDGEKDSSEVADYLNVGAVGTYSSILDNERPFSRGKDGDKGYVEADHIPPLESLRRARDQPEFRLLRHINPSLYNMVLSLRDDPYGRNLLTVQVLKHHHRDALSTGASDISKECRLLLARRIARGEVKKMLKQAFIIAHPYVSQQIRDDAEMGNKTPKRKVLISKDRTMEIYRKAFLQLIQRYFEMGIIKSEDKRDLIDYVENHGYLDRDSEAYQEILEIVKRGKLKKRN